MIAVDGVEGFLIPGDVRFLETAMHRLPRNPTVVEIGSWKGLSAIVMACARPDARINCVDTWLGSPEHEGEPSIINATLFSEFAANITRAGVSERIVAHQGTSSCFANLFAEKSIDLVFVDGEHSFDACLGDLEAWGGKIKPGGAMLVHDCVEIGVLAAVEHYCYNCMPPGALYGLTKPPHAHYMARIDF